MSALAAPPTTTTTAPRTARVTGHFAAVALVPHLEARGFAVDRADAAAPPEPAPPPFDFVWETTCPKAWAAHHASARLRNVLTGGVVLEDKALLALLGHKMDVPTVPTEVFGTGKALAAWGAHLWGSGAAPDPDWWVIKAAAGNGGTDVLMCHANNWRALTARLCALPDEWRVAQRYVRRPALWRNRKFHVRVFVTIRADLSALAYRKGFIYSANEEFNFAEDTANVDGAAQVHLTNYATNKHHPQYPGAYPCDFIDEYPKAWPRILDLVRSLVDASALCLKRQPCAGGFEFLGLDVMLDRDETVPWLLEVNRLPGMALTPRTKDLEQTLWEPMLADFFDAVVDGKPPARWVVAREAKPGEADTDCGPTGLALATLELVGLRRGKKGWKL